jgi:hypothetical protein
MNRVERECRVGLLSAGSGAGVFDSTGGMSPSDSGGRAWLHELTCSTTASSNGAKMATASIVMRVTSRLAAGPLTAGKRSDRHGREGSPPPRFRWQPTISRDRRDRPTGLDRHPHTALDHLQRGASVTFLEGLLTGLAHPGQTRLETLSHRSTQI